MAGRESVTQRGKAEALNQFPDASLSATLAEGASRACLPNVAKPLLAEGNLGFAETHGTMPIFFSRGGFLTQWWWERTRQLIEWGGHWAKETHTMKLREVKPWRKSDLGSLVSLDVLHKDGWYNTAGIILLTRVGKTIHSPSYFSLLSYITYSYA